jgi:hypothetical protein
MADRLLYSPPATHHCPVRGGHWTKTVPLQPGDFGYSPGLGFGKVVTIHDRDAPGTVRVCDECGKTWVAYCPASPASGQAWAPGIVLWAAEGRFARWRRVRRERSQ